MTFNAITILKAVTWICLTVSLTRGNSNHSNDIMKMLNTSSIVNIIGNFLNPLVGPIINKPQKHRPVGSNSKKQPKSNIPALIQTKVNSLTPYLQDAENDEDETTIIEFYPRRNHDKNEVDYATFENIHKFRKIRDVIKINLDKELVSDKTKKIVIKTVDALINKLNNSKCTQRTAEDSVITLRNGDSKNLTITMKDWKNITNLFFNNLQRRMEKKPQYLMTKADEINDFFINIMNNTIHSNTKQRMKCQLVEVPRAFEDEPTELDTCIKFKVCSTELNNYLTDFYNDTVATVDNTFKNYAAMFIRDANVDDETEKEATAKLISDLTVVNRERIDKVFEKHLEKFVLDKKKTKAKNKARLDNFVKGIELHTLKYVNKHLDTDLSDLRARTLVAVRDDINSNLKQDLTELEVKYVEKKCKHFSQCNGEVKKFRSGTERRSKHDNGVYVNLKLTMDDEMRNSILKPQALFQKYWHRRSGNKMENYSDKSVQKVTRTTFPDIKIKNINVKEEKNQSILVIETDR